MAYKNIFLIFILVLFSFSSCKNLREVSKEKPTKRDILLPQISQNKLFENIENNALNFNSIYAKKIDVSYYDGKDSKSFKATMKIERDSFAQFSFNAPLGIELARCLVTPDSVKFVNSFKKQYFFSDIHSLNDVFGFSVDYTFLQDIFTNSLIDLSTIDFEESERNIDNKRYKLERDSNLYILCSFHEKKFDKKFKKLIKKRQKNKDFILIYQETYINPTTFRPVYTFLQDVEDGLSLEISYDKFKLYNDILYPESVNVSVYNNKEKTFELRIDFTKIEFNVPVSKNIKITDKYKPIKIDSLHEGNE